MALKEIYQRLREAPALRDVRDGLSSEQGGALRIEGSSGSLPAFVLYDLLQQASLQAPLVCITGDEDAAAYLFSDLQQLIGDGPLLRLPSTGHAPYDREQVQDPAPLIERADVLQQLMEGFSGLLVTSIEALTEKLPPPAAVQQETFSVDLGDEIPPEDLVEHLVEQGFSHAEFVEEPGELALRGGILDVFPFSGTYPIRLEFFGDEIDSIREFDARTQRSVSRLKTARLVPNLERDEGEAAGPHVPLFDYLPEGAALATFDEARLLEEADARFARAEEAYEEARAKAEKENGTSLLPPAKRYLPGSELAEALRDYRRLLFGTFTGRADRRRIDLEAEPQPSFNASIDLVRRQLEENVGRGWRTYILCDSQGQASRLRELLEEEIDAGKARLVVDSLHEGFELPGRQLAVYTDHQIFNRYHRPTARRSKKYRGGLSLRDIQNLTPGDFVVHVDYGIGKFAGLHEIEVRGRQQEAVRLLFQDEDVLYINVNALHKLNKYSGKEGHQPRLTKLGTEQWERTKSRTKSRVKDMARELIKLYAKRKASDGYAFSKDTIWQREMEASFEFEDTPDQAAAAEAVKRDMEEPVPMDRLVCGDVGFGKTEVAVRAAFKAAQDGKQVAVLVPTTILAQQHYDTFSRRLEKYPVEVAMLSRFRTKGEQKEIIERLKKGQVDIVIGTHRLTSKDVRFKDLGLLIIDEEQRFGVKTKEQLRKLRAEVDTLALTATPIPRTLQFSLMGARDLSIIGTPPPNRQPIVTEIHTFDKDLIRDAILYEKSRGGQVFFIHNRVKTIREVAEMIRTLVPSVRVRVGHGQMRSRELEKVMVDFIEKKYDVLVSTTIIENGLDISNANTMIINRADRFGLSEMHQLRGRVGRSERKAFCYLLVPSIHVLTKEGRQRLQAIEEFSDLGSGFSIAMRDLDIRGAGSLLGGEQSGFIEDVGYETYHKILDEAVRELRSEEFSEVFEGEEAPPPAVETQVDVEADALIPDGYCSNNNERLNLYRRISEAGTQTALEEIRDEIADRFGPPPEEVDQLLQAAALKLIAQGLRLKRVLFKNERLFLYFPDQDEDEYFYETGFHDLLGRLADLERDYVLKDTKSGSLRAIVQNVPTLEVAQQVMEQLVPTEEAVEA